jgi:membrane carboxypeptidase/penicillin-binding protein
MPSTLPILRARRERRLNQQNKKSNRQRGFVLSVGIIISLLLGLVIILGAFAYADITQDLPSTEILPRLFNPPDGLLSQPTRIYDRTGLQLLATFSPDNSPRRYIPVSEANPQHIPETLINAVIAVLDPQFNRHSGYSIEGFDNPELHPTVAQKLVYDFLLYSEPPTTKRAIRERILASQITAQFGRTQIIEWYLNSANFGNHAYGVEAASQLYFGKPVEQLTLAESAILAAVIETPALNPLDAQSIALQRGREVLYVMNELRFASNEATAIALAEIPVIQSAPQQTPPIVAPAFVNMVLTQLESQIPRERLERGGITIITTLDYELQKGATCTTEIYATRLAGLEESNIDCNSARLLPSLPPAITFADSSASAIIIDPTTGQILALVGETNQGVETPLTTSHQAGSSLDAFVYLTGFTRGLSPASLTWDIPNENNYQNFDGEFHGPMRLRTALLNDYQVPVEILKNQMGVENVLSITQSFGIDVNDDLSLIDLASVYGVFATQGVHFGQHVNTEFMPVSVLRVESVDKSVMLDWSIPQAQTVITPAMSYVMTHVLSDDVERATAFDVNRPAGIKVGQTFDGKDAWVVGYTPYYVVATWTGVRNENDLITLRFPAVLWNALMQTASQNKPADGWSAPVGVSTITVCDPSGLLPTRECPNLVNEIFLSGSEPTQADNLYREFAINRETGLLATIFTPPELIDNKVYLVFPDEAREWAQSAGLDIPPTSYDAIQSPPVNPNVNITFPALFADVSGVVQIIGTASGENFVSYRVQVGKGLNPQEWIQLGGDVTTPVEGNILAEWDTTGLSGLYAVQLIVVRNEQVVDTAVIQVTIGE